MNILVAVPFGCHHIILVLFFSPSLKLFQGVFNTAVAPLMVSEVLVLAADTPVYYSHRPWLGTDKPGRIYLHVVFSYFRISAAAKLQTDCHSEALGTSSCKCGRLKFPPTRSQSPWNQKERNPVSLETAQSSSRKRNWLSFSFHCQISYLFIKACLTPLWFFQLFSSRVSY